MRQIADALMALMFFMTCLYVSYRMFPDVTKGRISEVDQWWKTNQQHLEEVQQEPPRRLEKPNRVANSKP